MSKLEFYDVSLEQMENVARSIVEKINVPTILFRADMAAGKTTLIKHIVKHLGSDSNVSSPTFSLVNHYVTASGKNIYHFDFYRIENPYQAFDMGYEEYFYSGDTCLVEWPENIELLLPLHCCTITIHKNENSRDVFFEY